MNNSDILPRVLVNAKLHRRVTADATHSRSMTVVQESLKHRCPPIEAIKEKVTSQHETTSDHLQLGLPVTNLHDKTSQKNLVGNIAPYSPVSSLSPACAAMANACNHDHDYISGDVVRVRRDSGLISRSTSPSKVDKLEEVANCQIVELKTVRIPIPPNKALQPTSPREAKQIREAGSRLRRRCVKVLEETPKNRRGRSIKGAQNEEVIDNSCIFVSTRRTAEPRKSRSRTSQQRKKKENVSRETPQNELNAIDVGFISSLQFADIEGDDDSSSVTSLTQEHFQANEFDVTKDKLTTEWQKLVKKYRPKKKDNGYDSDDYGFDDVGKPQRQSTPIRKERLSTASDLPSPRPSVTPCPPNTLKKTERSGKVCCNMDGDTKPGLSEDAEVTEQDSAYFSVDSSLNSIRPSSSVGIPIFRGEGRIGSSSRPTTGNRSAASTRPPSGGKRVAAASLSSTSSSSASSDDDSVCSSLSLSKSEGVNTNTSNKEHNPRRNRAPSFESTSKSPSHEPHQEHEVVKARKGKKFVRQIDGAKKQPHIRPIPPRKPKKDPLPMHLRALPTSFFQEPNRVSPSPYNILPPVQPLFRQVNADDVADIRPVTPPDSNRMKDTNSSTLNDGQRVIITGDPEMLQRLFDAVEPQHQATGRRIKRGRPKRAPRIMPSPKLTLDDDPCIMQSITDSLFPNLSIDKSNNKQTGVRNPVPTLTVERNKEEINFNFGSNSLGNSDIYSKELAQFEFISLSSALKDDDTADVAMEIVSPSMTSQRQEVLALPQLPATQDFSQMLSKVAACL